jgi:hypothetical protein
VTGCYLPDTALGRITRVGAAIGVSAILASTDGNVPAGLGIVTVDERIFGVWAFVAAWLLWRGLIEAPARFESDAHYRFERTPTSLTIWRLMYYVVQFFAGAFLCNAVPHLVCGLQGSPFPTPFARPRGIGLSPPLVNFAWGLLNLFVGVVLIWTWPVRVGPNASSLIFLLGVSVLGTFSSLHFGKVRRGSQTNGGGNAL